MMLVKAYWVVIVHVPGGGGVEGQVCCGVHDAIIQTRMLPSRGRRGADRWMPGTHSVQHKQQPAWGGGGRGMWHPESRSH
jgi:hypothetical protein